MISRIGKPTVNNPASAQHSWNSQEIHKYRPATRDGMHNERPECNYGGYHVWISDDWKEVTCHNCIQILSEQKTREANRLAQSTASPK